MSRGAIAAVIAALAAAAGFMLYRGLAPATAPAASAAVSGPASPAPEPAAAAAAKPARVVPDTVPDVSLADLSRKLHSLHEYRGRPTVFNFWATWCAPCRREIPLLNQLQEEHWARRLQIVGIAVDFREDVAKFATTTRFAYPLLVGEQDGLDAAAKFGLEMALPFSIFVDSQERIVAVKVGELHRDDADAILAALWAVDAGQLALAEAKATIGARLRELAAARALTAGASQETAP